MVTEKTSSETDEVRIGIDIGGTFTDFVIFDPRRGEFETFKLLSTPANPAEAVITGIERILQKFKTTALTIVHGSTVATNALLERRGARTAFVTTRGFRDLFRIGRQNRPELYNFFADLPQPLVPDSLCFEVDERVDHTGIVTHPLDTTQLRPLVERLQSEGVTSIAICLLFSFLHPEHEQMIAEQLRQANFFVSPSSEILPEYREYERASTTTVNAYVTPVLDRYLGSLEAAFSDLKTPSTDRAQAASAHFQVMQSNGGSISLGEARRSGVRCILSGPAGGIVGARHIADLAFALGFDKDNSDREFQPLKLITFDMGGTSTDVSLIDGAPRVTSESTVGGCPIHIPVLDIHTIGAGGGSIASVDLGGALRVGPESAGADPGPACYGRGNPGQDRPTVTDANLVLGRLAPQYFLGGAMVLDVSRASAALGRLSSQLGLDPIRTALGVIEVANAHMERALRVISIERGHDPQEFTLLSFGGAGGLHAADLARRLGIPRILVPPIASTLSAYGMLVADVIKDYSQTLMLPGHTPPSEIGSIFEPFVRLAEREIQAENIPPQNIVIERSLDMRYLGQSYELNVPWVGEGEDVQGEFHLVHRKAYGYSRPGNQVEIVNLRVRATGRTPPPQIHPDLSIELDPAPAFLQRRQVYLAAGHAVEVPFYQGELLRPGNRVTGPAIIIRADTTLLIGPLDQGWIDPYENLLINIGPNEQMA